MLPCCSLLRHGAGPPDPPILPILPITAINKRSEKTTVTAADLGLVDP
jgi:hypothetical protein